MKQKPSLELVAYRYESTGPTGLDYYKDRTKYMSVWSMVTPGFSAKLEIAGKRYESDFDIGSTLMPGLTRFIYEPYLPEKREAARIVLLENGACKIETPTDVCYVEATAAGFSFYAEEDEKDRREPIATITQLATCEWMPSEYIDVCEAAYVARIYGTQSLLLVMGILSYPALCFV